MKFLWNAFMLPWLEVLVIYLIKEKLLYSQENFRGTLENCEKRKSLA